MRTLIHTILFLTFSMAFSQKTLDYNEVLAELENSSESLNTTLILPNSDFYIGITKNAIVENPEINRVLTLVQTERKTGKL